MDGNPAKPKLHLTNDVTHHSELRNKSIFKSPISNNKHIEVFKKVVLQDLKDVKIKKKEKPNYIKSGIQKLTKRKDVVIRPAKGGGGDSDPLQRTV